MKGESPTKLLFSGKTLTGGTLFFRAPLSFSYEEDRDTPCSSLSLSVPFQHIGEEFQSISASLNGIEFFSGTVDRQTTEKSAAGNFIRFECRNQAALLLDNEAKPCVYFQLTSPQLMRQLASPYGVEKAVFPFEARLERLTVKKGSCIWQVIEDFCLAAYRKIPYMDQDGTILLAPRNPAVYRIGSSSQSAIFHSSLKLRSFHDKLISRIYLKTATEKNGYYYGKILENPHAIARGVRRERYFHPTSEVLSASESEAYLWLSRSNRESFSAEVILPRLLHFRLGDRVLLPDDAGNRSFTVNGISYRMDGTNGAATRLILSDEAFN